MSKEKAVPVIGIILIIAGIIEFAKVMFPVFAILTVLGILGLIIALFVGADIHPGLWIGVAILFGLTFASYGVGEIFGNSDIGVAITDTADAINQVEIAKTDAENQVVGTLLDATEEVVRESAS